MVWKAPCVNNTGGSTTGNNPSTCAVVVPTSGTLTVHVDFPAGPRQAPGLAILPPPASGNGNGTVTSSIVGTVPGIVGNITCYITAGQLSGTCSQYIPGTWDVTLTAVPKPGYRFAGWARASDISPWPFQTTPTLLLYRQQQFSNLYALFIPDPSGSVNLDVRGAGNGSGTVTSSPFGIVCDVDAGSAIRFCSNTFARGMTVTLTAAANPGSSFAGWTGACTGLGTCTVTLAQAAQVTASFVMPTYALSVGAAGNGDGSVRSVPAGISCDVSRATLRGNCSANFTVGSTVTLSQTVSAGNRFIGWTGDCTGTGSCQVTLDRPRHVTASFVGETTIGVGASGTGNGSVTSAPAGITCTITAGVPTGTCSALFRTDKPVTLTPTPAPGNTFVGWTGACSGTGPCTFTATAPTSAIANFAPSGPTTTLTVGAAGPGSGTVTSTPAGISCIVTAATLRGTCWSSFAVGSTVTLAATANAGSSFLGWTGACTGAGPCLVTLDQAKTVIASYVVTGSNATAIPDALTAVRDFLTGNGLTPAERRTVDMLGNKDGAFDLGDVLALLDHAQVRLPDSTMSQLLALPRAFKRSLYDGAPTSGARPNTIDQRR